MLYCRVGLYAGEVNVCWTGWGYTQEDTLTDRLMLSLAPKNLFLTHGSSYIYIYCPTMTKEGKGHFL